jgi:serine/threonine protein kinase
MDQKSLGRYEIVRSLEAAPWGSVYEAKDAVLQARVILHCVQLRELSPDAAEQFTARFLAEAAAASRLAHPTIAGVTDFGRVDDCAYLVTQQVEGVALKERLDRGERVPLSMAVALMRDLLSALAHAHAQGIVHQGVRPANLLLANGRLRLTGFGMGCIQQSEATTGAQLGALSTGTRFMSPEQVRGQPLDARSDVFSAGVVLYEMLTGTRPFDADNPFAIIQRILSVLPPPPTQVVAGLPAALDRALAGALAKDKDARFASTRDFLRALEGFAPAPAPVPAPVPAAATTHTVPHEDPIALELELEYWKDIKESEEAEDFLGYLKEFPAGRFVPLAHRRLRKMGQGTA